MTFASAAGGECTGTLEWIKPPQPGGAAGTGAFSVGVNILAVKNPAPPAAAQ